MIAALNVADRIRKEEISKQEIYSDFADIFDQSANLLTPFEIGNTRGKIANPIVLVHSGQMDIGTSKLRECLMWKLSEH